MTDQEKQDNQDRAPSWKVIAGLTVLLVVSAGGFGYAYFADRTEAPEDPALAAFVPSPSNPDPSRQIPGVQVVDFPNRTHIKPGERVVYTFRPPIGGSHDRTWATCTGVVYERPVRSENVVHSLEHGAVWIAYDPRRVDGESRASLATRVDGRPYTLLSPVPDLDVPVALQSWGHQLKLDDPNDQRLDQFLTALRQNPNTHPEVGATCRVDADEFDPQNPPPYEAPPATGQIGTLGVRGENDAREERPETEEGEG